MKPFGSRSWTATLQAARFRWSASPYPDVPERDRDPRGRRDRRRLHHRRQQCPDPIYLKGGEGDDVLVDRGSGHAEIDGGDNDDTIEAGPLRPSSPGGRGTT